MTPEQVAALVDVVFYAVAVSVVLSILAGRFAADALAFALSKWPAYRAWQRKRARAENIGWLHDDRLARVRRLHFAQAVERGVAARLDKLALDKSAVRW